MIKAYGENFDFAAFMSAMRATFKTYRNVPVVTFIAMKEDDPFKILIGTILSARTKDETTGAACQRLFAKAPTADKLARLTVRQIEKLIYPVGFYHNKATHIRAAAKMLENEFDGHVPDTLDALMRLPGVGRKTANLVLNEAFRKEAICVDTHVHRISNRLGLIETNTPAQTEKDLEQILPRRHWIRYNTYLVAHGQAVCHPVSPRCSQCAVARFCKRIGVTKSR